MWNIPAEAWALFALVGALAGFLAGLLGIGGGMVIVPALIIILQAQGESPEVVTHMAIGTSLASILLTSTSSIRTHHQHGSVDWSLLARLAPGLLLGSLVGAWIADALPARTLQLVIGSFAIWTGLKMWRGSKPDQRDQPLPSGPRLVAAGSVIGIASAIFGIGGGSLMVPFLSHHGVRMQRAIGTAAACGFPIAAAGTAGFIWAGWNHPMLPAGSSGYVFWPALLGLAVTSLVLAHWGARAAHALPAARLKQIFGVLLIFIGLRFLGGV